MALRLILIRHAETDWNQQKRYCGFRDIGINQRGSLQARCLRKKMQGFFLDRVYASDRKRSLQTAEIIFGAARIKKCAGLGEMNFGVFEGLTHQQILRRYPRLYSRWLKDPGSVLVPQAESLPDFKQRINFTLGAILKANHDTTVAIVTHGGPISVILNSMLKEDDFWGRIPALASISVASYKKARLELEIFNDTRHLNG